MATVIDAGDGRFIVGDPPTVLPSGFHWCGDCGGDGLEWLDDTINVCSVCDGRGLRECAEPDCATHAPTNLRITPYWPAVTAQIELRALAAKLTDARDLVATLRALGRFDDRLRVAYARHDALEAGVRALSHVVLELRQEAAA